MTMTKTSISVSTPEVVTPAEPTQEAPKKKGLRQLASAVDKVDITEMITPDAPSISELEAKGELPPDEDL